jgi:outer membrane immunogenic protein
MSFSTIIMTQVLESTVRRDLKWTITFSAALLSFSLSTPASAGDLSSSIRQSRATATPSWTGFYAGLNLGYGWKNESVDFSPNMANPIISPQFSPLPSVGFGTDGVNGGFQAGYNWQFNRNWLAGFEADFSFADMHGSGSSGFNLGGLPTLPFSTAAEEKTNWFGTLRARFGYLPTDNLLVYATAGFAYSRSEYAVSYNNNSSTPFISNSGSFSSVCAAQATCFAGSSARTATGWTAGGGAEFALWQNVTLKAEYLFVSLDGNSFSAMATEVYPGYEPASMAASFDRTILHVTRVGLNYRF